MNLKLITNQVCNLSRAVGIFIYEESKKITSGQVEVKGNHDFVTYVDKEAERRLIEKLKKIIPEAGFIAEESPELKAGDDFTWVIDPLDGTTNFIHNIPIFSISIALMYKKELISGVIYEINRDECFYAWKDGGAFLNGNSIKVTNTSTLNDSLLGTGFPYYDYNQLDEYLQLFKYFMKNTRGVRRLGSAAVDLAYLACGRLDGFYEYGLNPWDVAGGILIVKEAGGISCDFNGGDNYLYGKQLISSNKKIHNGLLQCVKKYFV
jgi:myo-inositol-1(or 4)-monophosphatase